MFRNITRFVKNPFGYIYWKMAPLANANRIRIIWAILMWQMYATFITYTYVKTTKENMINNWYYRTGMISDTQGPPKNGERFPADRKKNYVRYSNFHQKTREKKMNLIMFNWWSRDQNFRKYFAMRKKNGIRPSETGFRHTAIYDNMVKVDNANYDKKRSFRNME